jgi:hypothetical protein
MDPRLLHAAEHLVAGRLGEAASTYAAVARANPMAFDAMQRTVDCLAAFARTEPLPPERTNDAATAAFSSVAIGFCSIDAGKAARARASLTAALAPAPCTFHVITDARSLAEAFNRILAEVRADLVILCHDDIEILSSRIDLVLADALSQADIVGVAGARQVSGPAVLWSGHPHVHGWVTYPREGQWEAAVLSLHAGSVGGMQALDGVFLAMRGGTAARLRFDPQTFDGFHFYDLDFTYRAAMQGLRLAVTTDVLLVHASEGRFDEAWRLYAQRFQAKYPALRAPAGKPHWYGARFDSLPRLNAFYDHLRRHAVREPAAAHPPTEFET